MNLYWMNEMWPSGNITQEKPAAKPSISIPDTSASSLAPIFRATLLAIGWVVVTAAVLYLRRPNQFNDPYIWVEDGRYVLTAFAERGWISILEPVVGYHLLATKLITMSAFQLSIMNAPIIASIITVLFTALVMMAIAYSPTALLWRPLCALFVLLLPCDSEVYAVSEYAFWWAGLLVLLALLWSANGARQSQRILFILVGCLSSPLAVILAPLFILRAFVIRNVDECVATALAVAVAGVQAVALSSTAISLGGPPGDFSIVKIVGKHAGYFIAPSASPGDPVVIAGWVFVVGLAALFYAVRSRITIAIALLVLSLIFIVSATAIRMPIEAIHPFLAGPRYYFYSFTIIGWLLLWLAANSDKRFQWAVFIILGTSIGQSLPKMRRDHEHLDWSKNIEACAKGQGDYILPIHLNGKLKTLWYVKMTNVKCAKLIQNSLF